MYSDKDIFESNLYVKEGDICLDVGANTGVVSRKLLPLVGGGGEVFAFEPFRRAFMGLCGMEQDNFYPINVALSNETRKAKLFTDQKAKDGRGESTYGASTLKVELASERRLDSVGEMSMLTDTLDNFCARYFISPNFIKIDTEGSEEDVLKGGERVIKISNPVIYFEFGYGAPEKFKPKSHILLKEWGYTLYNTSTELELDEADLEFLEGDEEYFCNLLALPL